MWWRTRGRNREGYGLTYDYLGRMTKAQHVRLDNNNGARMINTYSEQMEYADPRGNISRILRYGMNYTGQQNAGSGIIDNLEFVPLPGTNRIQRINEQATDLALKLKGFRPKTETNGATTTTGIDYTYDANGNLQSDPHKGIQSIQYNLLNLPSMIRYTDGRTIESRYDMAGNLLMRWFKNDPNPANNYIQSYVNGIEVWGGQIEAYYHSEGRLFRTGGSNTSPVWRYEYNITDHLGNTRLTFSDKNNNGAIDIAVADGEVLEENHFYPFGMAMEGPWMNDAAAQDTRYRFNGIERLSDFGLNVEQAPFRTYDAAIGRWWQADPMGALAPDQTPYRFGFNNPMNFADPLGLFETRAEAKEYKREHDIKGTVVKNKEGRYEIRNKSSNGYITKNKDGEIEAGAVAYAKNAIREGNPNFYENVKNTTLGNLGYNFLDPLWTTLQDINPFDTKLSHLDRSNVSASERQYATTNFVLTVVPIGRSMAIMPKGLMIFKRLNTAQFSKLFKGTFLARMRPMYRGKTNKLMNFGINFINQKVESGNAVFGGSKQLNKFENHKEE